MIETDRKQFGIILASVAAALHFKFNDDAIVMAYFHALRDLELPEIKAAAERAMRTCKWFPKPVELRELAGLETPDALAIKAWQAVNDAIDFYGAYKSVDFEDPLINAVIRSLGGWEMLCATPPSEFHKWRRKEFSETYIALSRSGVSVEASAPLMGIHGRENAAAGYDRTPPVLISVDYKVSTPALPAPAEASEDKGTNGHYPVNLRGVLKGVETS